MRQLWRTRSPLLVWGTIGRSGFVHATSGSQAEALLAAVRTDVLRVREPRPGPSWPPNTLSSSASEPGDGSYPFFPARCAPFHAPDNRVAHRMKADEPQEIAIEALEAVGAEEEAIDTRWHSHRHDVPGGSAGAKLRRHSGRAPVNRKAGAQHLFEKTLQERRNVPSTK